MEEHAALQRYDGPTKRLQALIEASLALGESRDLATLLRRILELATEHVGADRGAIFLRRPDTGALIANIFDGDEVEQIKLPRGKGLAGAVAESGEPMRTDDAYSDPRFDRSVDARTGYRTRSVLVVPMELRDNEVVGVVQLLNKTDGGAFDQDDEHFLGALGVQAAVALERARLTEERIRGERMEAIGAMAANLVHDLRSPLSGIHGYTDIILQNPPEELLERCVEGVRRQTLRMTHMVTSILRFAKGEDVMLMRQVDLDRVLEEVVEDLRAIALGAEISVERTGDQLGHVRADPMALARLLDNLGRNAFEAMKSGGCLRIHATLRGEEAVIRMEDDGHGMPPEDVEALFAPFRTQGKESGTGLGLHIVHRVVQGHGGRIEVETAPGAGTSFIVSLPIKGPGTADSSEAGEIQND